MKPFYLRQLADIADPKKLWKLPALKYLSLKGKKRQRLDTGVALRRYASLIMTLDKALAENKSLLITPLAKSAGVIASRLVVTPRDHKKLRPKVMK